MLRFSSEEFERRKREKLLAYDAYKQNYDEHSEGFEIVRFSLAQPSEVLAAVEPYDLMQATHQRALDGLAFLMDAYSAGHPIDEIARTYPAVLEFWEAYMPYSEAVNASEGTAVAHIPLLDNDFDFANQLLTFAILLGWGSLVDRLPALFDYNNPRKDGMLERMLAPFVKARAVPPSESTRGMPYTATVQIFNATPADRSALMQQYLQSWYKNQGYHRFKQHKQGGVFHGYWSWEAAAISYLLDIDDSSFAELDYYPADLVAYARQIGAPRAYATEGTNINGLRATSGQPCPQSGTWETLDIPAQRRFFNHGAIVEAAGATHDVTNWRFVEP